MAPLPPQSKALRRPPPRPASFHGRSAQSPADEPRQIWRPRTQPELLGLGQRSPPSPPTISGAAERKVPRSIGQVQVMASTEWTVGELVAAAARIYSQEGRRPPLPFGDPSDLRLHYSPFSLETSDRLSSINSLPAFDPMTGLDPEAKLIDLGSRSFFLCPAEAKSCSDEVEKTSRVGIPWLKFMGFSR
ncbi:hypothetical protein AXF42_Ash002241 [Apostasia shenzhenica]|uniref:DUF7054 domain-containing protein n=1 Tax=Apostasia shenzhenica TaxID=1088818 RepID=A0A2I0AMY9_9ASPA|nr:hypothetical protein AXF42_Ash002241 [Apostasia shenzhenica]